MENFTSVCVWGLQGYPETTARGPPRKSREASDPKKKQVTTGGEAPVTIPFISLDCTVRSKSAQSPLKVRPVRADFERTSSGLCG
eukprot:scaffold51247_cov38-Cyclotella_meneghiniana.AAC.1